MVKQLDPATATLAEVAQAHRSLKYARWAGIGVAVLVAALMWSPVLSSDWLDSRGLALLVLVVPAALGYRVTYEILSRVLPPN